MLHRENTPLRRLLGPLDAASLLVGCVLGAGVLIVPGQIAPRLPSAALGLTLWLAGAIVSVVGSWCVARLAAEAPTAGGSYSYLRRCYGDTVGFLSGWTGLVIVNCAVPAALALALGSAAKRLMPSLPDPMSSAGIAILASATVALVGLKLGKQLLNVLSLVKLLGVGLVVGTVLWKQPSALSRVAEWTSSEPFSWASIGAAFIGILWTYDGWTYLAFAGEEARQPSRTLRIGFRAGIVVVAVAVLTATTAYYAALPAEQMAASEAPIALTVMNHYWGSAGELLMHPIILAAIFGSLCALFTTASRASLQMARDGALPALLGRVSKRSCVPWVAILLQAAGALALLTHGTFGQILAVSFVIDWLFKLLLIGSLLRPLPHSPGAPAASTARSSDQRPLAVRLVAGGWCVVIAGVVMMAAWSEPRSAALGLLLAAAGMPVRWLLQRRGAALPGSEQPVREAEVASR